MPEKSERKVLKHWHQLFGAFLARQLQPADIGVEVEVSAAIKPPTLDVLLLRRDGLADWSDAQRAVLPDGIRDTSASRIVIEFKYTQSLDLDAFHQTLLYDVMYRKSQKLSTDQVSTFLVCSKRPIKKTLTMLNLEPSTFPGVYRSSNAVSARVCLISLNDLSTTNHNVAFKLFASRPAIRDNAFDQLNSLNEAGLPDEALWFAHALKLNWKQKGADHMMPAMTEEEIIEIGKSIGKSVLRRASIQERLEGIAAKDRLEGIAAKDRLEGIAAKDRLEGIAAKDRLEGIAAKDRLEGIAAKDRLEGIPPQDLLEYLSRLSEDMKQLIGLRLRPEV